MLMEVLRHPGHGTSRCCIVGNWTWLPNEQKWVAVVQTWLPVVGSLVSQNHHVIKSRSVKQRGPNILVILFTGSLINWTRCNNVFIELHKSVHCMVPFGWKMEPWWMEEINCNYSNFSALCLTVISMPLWILLVWLHPQQ